MRGVGVVGPRPLHWASFKGAQEVVRMLLEHGADVEAKHCVGDTALQKAAVNGYAEVVKLPQDHGAKPSSRFLLVHSL